MHTFPHSSVHHYSLFNWCRLHDHAMRIETSIYNTISNAKVSYCCRNLKKIELTAPL